MIRKFVVILWLLCFSLACTNAQDKVSFDYLPNSNDFIYPDTAMDRIIKPGGYKAFFYGETHTRYFEPMFKLHYIQYLNTKYGIKDVFMEMGYSAAVVFNQFLATGDTSLIRFKVLYTSPCYMVLWKQLYAYNKTLADDRKIKIYAVDFEAMTFFEALLLLMPAHKDIPTSLTTTFQHIRAYANDTALHYGPEFVKKANEIKRAFKQYAGDVGVLYESNLKMVNKIVNNNISMDDKQRDKKLYAHMQEEIKENRIDKFVGFFGGDHINYESGAAISNAFKKSSNFRNKVITIRALLFNAYDNWSHETLECIGVYSAKEGHTLHEKYMTGASRAVLIPSAEIQDPILNRSADYYLFANDKGNY